MDARAPFMIGCTGRRRPKAAALCLVAASLPVTAAPAHARSACAPWTTVAKGYGPLENLAFDGRGGLLLSKTSFTGGNGALRRLAADGTRSTAVGDVPGPGGIVVHGPTAYFTTGNALASGLLDRTDGAVRALDLGTGEVTTVATGLTMPNGLARLPDGDFVVSRDIGVRTGLTRAPADGGEPAPYGPALYSTNGLAVDRARHRLYVAGTFTATSTVTALDVRGPATAPKTFTLPGIGPLNSADELTVAPDGAGPGWDSGSLYATSFLGTVTRLTP